MLASFSPGAVAAPHHFMAIAKPKLLVVVKERFWDCARGSSIRISLLLHQLSNDYEIELFCLRRLTPKDFEELRKNLPTGKLRFSLPAIWSPGIIGAALLRRLRHRPDTARPASSQPGNVKDWMISESLRRTLNKGSYAVVLCEYIWTAKFLNPATLDTMPADRWLDTHDIMHLRHASSQNVGITVKIPLALDEETKFFRDFSRLIAIQNEEAVILKQMAPGKEVVTIPVIPRVESSRFPRPPTFSTGAPCLLHVSSSGKIANHSLRWFLVHVWPAVIAARPDAQLHVLGSICNSFKNESLPNTIFHGFVENLAPYYQHAILSINPCLAGSGLKIKTVEALAYDQVVVTTPFGAQGIDPAPAKLMVREPDQFLQGVLQALEPLPIA
ncbi:MAG: hypothetical protein RLZZ398_351 [Verrucomicrobiota bacterium]|jgi:hypothetical protein